MEKEQQQKERLLKDYLLLIEIPVIGLAHEVTRIINAARYLHTLSSISETCESNTYHNNYGNKMSKITNDAVK